MNQETTSEIMAKMLSQLARNHFYGQTVTNLTIELGTYVSSNHQLHELLDRCARRCNFQTTQMITWSDLRKDEKKILNCFFDYLYFTSPQFIKDAG